MKVRVYILIPLLLALVLLLSCCMKPEEGHVPSSGNELETPTNISVPYSKAYFDIVVSLIREYGFYTKNERFGDMGFIRGDLIDFEKDGIPELVCIYRKEFFNNICIYTFSENHAALLVDQLTGDSILGDNFSQIKYAEIDNVQYILTQKCDWGKVERIYVYTVNGNLLHTTELYAETQIKEEDNGPFIDSYLNCRINNKSVTEEEYITQMEYFYKDYKKTIMWDRIKENDDIRDYTKDDAIQFVVTLANDAGNKEDEALKLVNDTNTED